MKIIGLIGGCGTGKTKVADILQERYNAYSIIADSIGHEIIKKGQPAYELIVDYFGSDILDEKNEINRRALGSVVFKDENALKKLNGFTHPNMYKMIQNIISDISKNNIYDFVILEAAVMIEARFYELTDLMWFITSSLDSRIYRLTTYRGITEEKAKDIISKQHDEEFFKSYADEIIDNSEDIETTINQIDKLMLKIEETMNEE